MKRLKILLILIISLNFSIASSKTVSSKVKWVDRIVMVVNDDVVTERDLNDMMFNIKKQNPEQIKINNKQLKQAAMQRLLEEKLLIQFAKNRGISASEEEVNKQISNIASYRKMTVAKLYELISKEGVDKKSLHDTIANNLIVEKVLNDYLPVQSATEDEVKELLTKNKAPITKDNYNKAFLFINRQKFQQSYLELIESLKSSAYVKINDKPY